MESFKWVISGLVIAVMVGLLAIACLVPPADRWTAADVVVGAGGALATVYALWLAASEFHASRRAPELVVEWRAGLGNPWGGPDVVGFWEAAANPGPSGLHFAVRLSNIGSRAATLPMVRFEGEQIRGLFSLTLNPVMYLPVSEPEWTKHWDEQFGEWKPRDILYPGARTPEYEMFLFDKDTLTVSAFCAESPQPQHVRLKVLLPPAD